MLKLKHNPAGGGVGEGGEGGEGGVDEGGGDGGDAEEQCALNVRATSTSSSASGSAGEAVPVGWAVGADGTSRVEVQVVRVEVV